MEKQTQKALKDQVLKEFPAVGKYRIRLLVDPARPGAEPTLDIREYVSSQTFEGLRDSQHRPSYVVLSVMLY